jgi:hypothetical protein
MTELTSALLAMGFASGGVGVFFAALVFAFNYGSPQENYRKTFDKTIECREKVKTPTDIDAICGKVPQWSEFVKETK